MERGFFAAFTLAALVAAGARSLDRGAARPVRRRLRVLEPVEPPEATYLGLTATTYHLIALYGANALLLVAAFGRSHLLDRPVGRSRGPRLDWKRTP